MANVKNKIKAIVVLILFVFLTVIVSDSVAEYYEIIGKTIQKMLSLLLLLAFVCGICIVYDTYIKAFLKDNRKIDKNLNQ